MQTKQKYIKTINKEIVFHIIFFLLLLSGLLKVSAGEQNKKEIKEQPNKNRTINEFNIIYLLINGIPTKINIDKIKHKIRLLKWIPKLKTLIKKNKHINKIPVFKTFKHINKRTITIVQKKVYKILLIPYSTSNFSFLDKPVVKKDINLFKILPLK